MLKVFSVGVVFVAAEEFGATKFTVIERKEKIPCPVRELNEEDKTKTTEPSTDPTSDSEDPTLPSLEEECFDPSNIKPNDWGFTGSYEVSQNWGGISHLTLTQTIESPTPLKNDYLYQTYL